MVAVDTTDSPCFGATSAAGAPDDDTSGEASVAADFSASVELSFSIAPEINSHRSKENHKVGHLKKKVLNELNFETDGPNNFAAS